jgi:hypothetical protein
LSTGDTDCTTNLTIYTASPHRRCPEGTTVATFSMAVYVLFANVLLLNILIAMFRYINLCIMHSLFFKDVQICHEIKESYFVTIKLSVFTRDLTIFRRIYKILPVANMNNFTALAVHFHNEIHLHFPHFLWNYINCLCVDFMYKRYTLLKCNVILLMRYWKQFVIPTVIHSKRYRTIQIGCGSTWDAPSFTSSTTSLFSRHPLVFQSTLSWW